MTLVVVVALVQCVAEANQTILSNCLIAACSLQQLAALATGGIANIPSTTFIHHCQNHTRLFWAVMLFELAPDSLIQFAVKHCANHLVHCFVVRCSRQS